MARIGKIRTGVIRVGMAGQSSSGGFWHGRFRRGVECSDEFWNGEAVTLKVW